ncbi:MAG: FHA domain-containing protein [Myxococcota bacterium]
MAPTGYIVVGRSPDCDVVVADPTVSGRHMRMSWQDGRIVVEDLGSANGTYVRGEKVDRAEVRPGEDVRMGRMMLAWSHAKVRAFLRQGASGQTIRATSIPGRRFICGVCGERSLMPEGFRGGELRCPACRSRLEVGAPRRSGVPGVVGAVIVLVLAVGAAAAWALAGGGRDDLVRRVQGSVHDRSEVERAMEGAGSPQEASIRVHTVPKLTEAIDYDDPTTRNTAVRIAADEEGPYRVEQVARLWTHARGRWRYVNDPKGNEYFAKASETIDNEWAGDCDDFAVVLAAMITAIGGESRIVMMDGPQGGHAYAEACVREEGDDVRKRLAVHYRRTWDRYLGRQRVKELHYRPGDGECAVWLNLDWNAGVPGGPYEPERWAVAIHPDGKTETLAPAGAPPPAGRAPDEGITRPPATARP